MYIGTDAGIEHYNARSTCCNRFALAARGLNLYKPEPAGAAMLTAGALLGASATA